LTNFRCCPRGIRRRKNTNKKKTKKPNYHKTLEANVGHLPSIGFEGFSGSLFHMLQQPFEKYFKPLVVVVAFPPRETLLDECKIF
jgi:hypothetical protein